MMKGIRKISILDEADLDFLEEDDDGSFDTSFENEILEELEYEATHQPKKNEAYEEELENLARHAINTPRLSFSFSLEDTDESDLISEATSYSLWYRTYCFLDRPNTSRGAFVYQLFLQLLVLGTIVLLCLESFESLIAQPSWADGLFYTDMAITIVFTIDYFARLILYPGGCKKKKKFILNPFNIIDFLSILPFYLELAISASVVSVIRVVRLFRIFKLIRMARFAKYFKNGHILVEAVKRAKGGIFFLCALMILLCVFFGSLMYYAETLSCFLDENNIWIYKEGPATDFPTFFQNIPLAMWWAIVTMATIGYGDAFPYNWLGRGVGVLTIIGGVLILGFPVVIIGGAYMDVQSEYKERVEAMRRGKSKSIQESKRYQNQSLLQNIIEEKNRNDMIQNLELLDKKLLAMEELRDAIFDNYLRKIKL